MKVSKQESGKKRSRKLAIFIEFEIKKFFVNMIWSRARSEYFEKNLNEFL